jgi:hypothetical protein
MGRNDCSVCQSAVASNINAELLKPAHERMTLRELAARSGISRSSLGRHSLRCIPLIRLSFNRDKKGNASGTQNGRIIVAWPELAAVSTAHFSSGEQVISPEELRESDVLFVVSYQNTHIANFQNPRGLAATPENLEKLFDLALVEEQERSSQTSGITPN